MSARRPMPTTLAFPAVLLGGALLLSTMSGMAPSQDPMSPGAREIVTTRLEVAGELVEVSRRQVDLTQSRLEAGRCSETEVLQAKRDWLEARLQELTIRQELLQRRVVKFLSQLIKIAR